ncbi:competence protein ComK [Sporosarcina sp. A2]|uniref:competence protein ComK n=1 Tax=Sporosarcina sp. A2 TaxID=3393449 RepID=UPI003D7BAC68
MMNCESYLLDSQALALIAYKDDLGSLSKIVTLHGTYTSKKSPAQLLHLACLHNQSTVQIQKKVASAVLKFKHKPPFLVSQDVGVFPTSSSKHETCCYIFNHFFTPTEIDKSTTLLTFSNGATVTVPVSMHIVQQQNGRLHTLLSHSTQLRKELYFDQYLFSSDRMNR